MLCLQKHTLLMEHSDGVSALAVINGKLVSGSWDTNIKVGRSGGRNLEVLLKCSSLTTATMAMAGLQ